MVEADPEVLLDVSGYLHDAGAHLYIMNMEAWHAAFHGVTKS